jgi:uncharacterized iron-regulated membrane protein
MDNRSFWDKHEGLGEGVVGTVIVLILVGLITGAIFAFPAVGRYQKRQAAKNNILVTELEIQNTAQKVKVEEQKAAVRVAEARGISDSQHIINATLTDKYLQHEAINAQKEMANSPNHTTIYIPSGQNGIPLVTTTNQ